MEAITVRQTVNTRYRDEAPKTIPSRVPTISARAVSSGSTVSARIYGRNEAASGFSGLAPTISGNSFAPTLSDDIRVDLQPEAVITGIARGSDGYFTRAIWCGQVSDLPEGSQQVQVNTVCVHQVKALQCHQLAVPPQSRPFSSHERLPASLLL